MRKNHEGSPHRRPIFQARSKKLLRLLVAVLIWLVLGLVTLWAVAALYIDVRVSWLRLPLAVIYGLGMLASALLVKGRRLATGICLGGFALVLAWWFSLKPSNNRNWLPEVAVLPSATVDGSQVTIRNIRNFEYRTATDFTPRYYDRTFDLNDLESVDLICVYWGSDAIAHVMVSFGFGGNNYVCFSIETRPERGEGYSTIKGFFRQYELYYVVADERDVIGLRANYRQPPEQVYIFRTRIPLENQRKLFLDYIRRVNELAKEPAWYNTLTENCATGVLLHTKAYAHRARYNWKILLSGYTAEYAYEMGGLDTNMPFAELRERGHVNERARAAGKSDDFSQAIREGMPLPKPLSLEESMRGQ